MVMASLTMSFIWDTSSYFVLRMEGKNLRFYLAFYTKMDIMESTNMIYLPYLKGIAI